MIAEKILNRYKMIENKNVKEEQKHPIIQNQNPTSQINQSNQIIIEDPLSETMTDEQIKRKLTNNITAEEKAEEKAAAEEVTAVEEEDEAFNEPSFSKDPTDD